MITRLPAAERNAVPWKNAGGVTREVAVYPPGADMETFDWRVSMAEVSEAGPFSMFDGIDRHLTVLRGRLQLDFADRSVMLTPLEYLAFSGSDRVHGTPLEPVLDLNVMTRRGRISASVRQVTGAAVTDATTVLLIDPVGLDALLIEGGGDFHAATPSILIEFA